jgi:hypothetical protein
MPSPPVLLESPPSSTPSAHGASAPAPTRGLEVVSFNIGARTDDMFSSEAKRPMFIGKLRDELDQLCRRADIICLQECSPSWSQEVLALTPLAWKSAAFLPDATVLTTWNGDRLRQAQGTEVTALKLFPDSNSVKRQWRECLAVALEQVDFGSIILFVDNHTIDGTGDRKISGDRDSSTQAALQGAVEAAIRFRTGLATTQSSIGLASTPSGMAVNMFCATVGSGCEYVLFE